MKESQDSKTDDAARTRRRQRWQQFFDLVARIRVPEDFLADRGDAPPQERRLF